jgi:hypothetical protein
MTDAATPNKKGKGCLVGCLVALAVAVGIAVIVGVVAYTHGGRILRWGADRLSGGGVQVEAPEGYRAMPLPIALAVPGARASAFTGDLPAEETSAAFANALRKEGWQPIRGEEAPTEAFAFVVEGADGARMAMDFFEKGDDVLLLYVTGTARQTTAGLIAMPRDEARRREAAGDAEPAPPARRQPAPSKSPPDRDAKGREDAAIPRIPGAFAPRGSGRARTDPAPQPGAKEAGTGGGQAGGWNPTGPASRQTDQAQGDAMTAASRHARPCRGGRRA